MISPTPPPPAYDANNEAQFRRQVQAADAQNLKTTGFVSFVMVDSVSGSPYNITLASGVLTATIIPA